MTLSGRLQLLCAWSGLAFLAVYAFGFVVLAGFIPPPSPSLSSTEVATLFDDNRFGIRAGMVLGLFGSTLLFPYFATISRQIRKAQTSGSELAAIQFGAAVLLVVFFGVCNMFWIAATFREELAADSVRMLNDIAWLMFVMVAPGYTVQLICIAIAGFADRRPRPTFPRWLSYLNIWVGFSGLGGSLAVFFKTGPFAWNGLIGFWIPVGMFVGWLMLMTFFLHRAACRDEADRQATSFSV